MSRAHLARRIVNELLGHLSALSNYEVDVLLHVTTEPDEGDLRLQHTERLYEHVERILEEEDA